MTLNFRTPPGTCKDQQGQTGPQSERPVQDEGMKFTTEKKIKVGGKDEVQAHKAHASPFLKDCPNPSLTDLPTRKKYD